MVSWYRVSKLPKTSSSCRVLFRKWFTRMMYKPQWDIPPPPPPPPGQDALYNPEAFQLNTGDSINLVYVETKQLYSLLLYRCNINCELSVLLAYETCCYTTSRRSRNHSTVAGHGLVRLVWDPIGGPSLVHSDRMWSAVCSGAPHRQAAEGLRPQRYMLAPKRPTPVRRRFKVTHSLRGDQLLVGCLCQGGWWTVQALSSLANHASIAPLDWS